jgi:hypothetical protein
VIDEYVDCVIKVKHIQKWCRVKKWLEIHDDHTGQHSTSKTDVNELGFKKVILGN